VAASATAILIDISLTAFFPALASVAPEGAVKSMQIRQKAGLPRYSQPSFLTACVNQTVSTRSVGLTSAGGRRGNVGNKVNDLKTTLAGKRPQQRHSC
jgi:hypothetical protein